jgi:integrase
VKAFLEWCVASHYLPANPLSGAANRIRIARVETKEILTLGVPEVRRLLQVASAPEHQSLLGWIALALFAGVRPQEIARSTRQSLNLEEGIFKVIAVPRRENYGRSGGCDCEINAGKLERGPLGMCNRWTVAGGTEGFEP